MASDVGDRLEQGFLSPPASARPHTWWHWMNGNVTKEGITADLESMQRVGIGGAQIFNPLEGIPDGPVPYMSPQWLDMFRHAAAEADRLGLELCFHNCAGWSSSGGPWIKPAQAMQTVVISETQAKGPAKFDAVLPQPQTNHGYYRDIAVLAFPTPSGKGNASTNCRPRRCRSSNTNTECSRRRRKCPPRQPWRVISIVDADVAVSGPTAS